MNQTFSSKEIHFLKTNSENVDLKTPETFFSDLLLNKTEPVKHFEKRLTECEMPTENFICAVIRIDCSIDEGLAQKARTAFEDTFTAFLDHERGIWETIAEDAMALAFWEPEKPGKAILVLKSIREKLEKTLETNILVGVAQYPFHSFNAEDVFANALKAADHAAFFGPSTLLEFDAVSLNICADRRYQLNLIELAVKDYQKGLEISQRDTNLLNSLGVCYGILNNLDQAREQFENALKITPNDAMVLYNIGLIYMIKEDIDKAVIYLKKAHGVNDQVFEVELLLGRLLFKTDFLEPARSHLETAARLNSSSGLVFRNLGEIYLKKNAPERASKHFNTAIKCNPADAVSLSGYAKSLEMQGKNLQIALTFAKNSVAIDPGNPLYEKRLSTIMDRLNLSDTSEKDMKTA